MDTPKSPETLSDFTATLRKDVAGFYAKHDAEFESIFRGALAGEPEESYMARAVALRSREDQMLEALGALQLAADEAHEP